MPINFQLKKWKRGFFELLFPPYCYLCSDHLDGSESKCICESCLDAIPYVNAPLCRICGRNFTSKEAANYLCEECLRKKPKYSLARSITYYAEPVSTLLHHFKYHFETTASPPLLEIAQSFDFSPFQDCDIILPVPLHKTRLRKRGLNHALYLARLFFPDRLHSIHNDILIRTRRTISQTRLDGVARRRNLRSAFSVKNKELIEYKKVCLVDDIITTGTTAGECANTLIKAGATDIRVLTMARVKHTW